MTTNADYDLRLSSICVATHNAVSAWISFCVSVSETCVVTDADGEDDDVDNQHEALIDLLEGNLVQQAIQQLVNISPSDFFDEEIYLDDPMEVVIPDVATLLQQQQQLSHLHEAETEFEDSTDSEMTNDDDTDNEDDDNVGFLFPIPVMDDDDPDYIP